MPYVNEPQRFAARINTLTFGSGQRTLTLGGENVFPLYAFDGPIENRPAIGVSITDSGYRKGIAGLDAYYDGAETVVDAAKKASAMPGADFLAVSLCGAHPDNGNKSVEECAELVREIADAVDIPIAVEGCKNVEKDAKLLEAVAQAVFGRNVLILSAREENYKGIATAAGLAYQQKVVAESSVDVNLAKQLNVLVGHMGLKPGMLAMDVGSAAAGYGFEYVSSTMERVRLAALAQNDAMLQMPIITPVYSEAWAVKESLAGEEDYPEWGPLETRGVNMEITTAAACLAAGSNAVILLHPASIATISALINELTEQSGRIP